MSSLSDLVGSKSKKPTGGPAVAVTPRPVPDTAPHGSLAGMQDVHAYARKTEGGEVMGAEFRDVTATGVGVELECVLGGVLMRLHFASVRDPMEIPAALRAKDPGVQFRTEFPKAGGGFGKKETKQARALVLNVDVRDAGKFVSITCQGATDDLTVSVGRKVVDEWEGKLKMLAKLTDRSLAKVAKAFAEKKSATVVLSAEEQFGVGYWSTEDGKNFLEEMTAEPPAAVAGAGEGAGT